MTNALQIIASGTWLWFVLAAGAGVLVYLVLKWPTLCKVLTWPVRLVLNPVLTWLGNSTLGVKVKATKLWLWLESKQYDPPAHPLSWWVPRGLVVLWLVGVFGATCYWHGHGEGRSSSVMPLAFMGKEYVPIGIERAWKNRALECEKTADPLKVLDAPMITPNVIVPTALPPASDTPVAPPKPALKTATKKKAKAKSWWE